MTNEIFYKVSFVVAGGEYPGAIITVDHKPKVGEEVQFNSSIFTITEVMELMPTVGNFGFLHVTCEFAHDVETKE